MLSNWKQGIRNVAWWIVDRVWPMLETDAGDAEPSHQEPIYPVSSDQDVLKASMELLKAEISAENERNRIVEGKLQSLLGFNTVAMGIVTAMVTFLTSSRPATDNTTVFSPLAVALFVGLGAYVALQLFRTVWASIKGLQRRGYSSLTVESIAPSIEDSDVGTYYARMYSEMCDCLRENHPVIDDKVSQMAVAHTAVLNAIFGLLVLLVVAVCAVLLKACS